MNSQNKIRILFIAGHTRSGSTLLDRMLGQVNGFFSIGEAKGAWDAFIGNWLCECGKSVKECNFWNSVVKVAFGGFSDIDLDKVRSLQQSVSRIRYLPMLSFPTLRLSKYRRRHAEYGEILDRFYKAIWAVSGEQIIIDSSKNPAHALLLNEVSDIKLNVIHLIRDSQAVAYSWQRKRRRPEVTAEEAHQETYGPVISSLQWSWANVASEWLSHVASQSTRVKYEDLANSPREIVLRIFDDLQLEKPSLDFFVDGSTIKLQSGHTIFGNPMRMEGGVLKIRPDMEWQQKMTPSNRLTVTALTGPLLLRYGYLRGSEL